jgi:hypothetical protein
MDLVLIAIATAARIAWPRILLLVGCLYLPWVWAGLMVGYVWLSRRTVTDPTARLCEAVAAELRAGSSIRQALAAAAASVGEAELAREAMTMPLDEYGGILARSFPSAGAELEVALAGSATSTPNSVLFEELADLAAAHDEIRREVRVASAPGRAAAGIFLGAPVLYVGARWSALGDLFADPTRQLIGFIGLTLFLAGLAGTGLVLKRAA